MPVVCLYLKAHQPRRIKRYSIFDIGHNHSYFDYDGDDDLNNVAILKKVARKSYLPTNKLLLKLLNKHPDFRVSFSMTGTLLDQLEEHVPKVIELFQELVATGRVEILGETYHHSLSYFYSIHEFENFIQKLNLPYLRNNKPIKNITLGVKFYCYARNYRTNFKTKIRQQRRFPTDRRTRNL